MQQNQNTVLLNGIGGMGKSELLHYWVHQVAKGEIKLGYDNIMYISCTNGIANVFENNSIEAQALGIQPDNPNKLETAKFKLSQLDNLLLVLDDLPWEEQPYIDNINHVTDLCGLTPHVIATSRREYNNFEKVSVPALDVEDASKLFNNHFESYVTASCENAIKQVVKRAGRHTLTIEILAKTASENEWSVTELLETLEANHFDYEALDTNVEYTKAGKYAEETLHNALEKLFDLSDLTDAQKQILYHLSCMDSQAFIIKAITNWLEIKTPAIKKLIKLGWIQPSQQTNNTQFYQLHQTITHTVKTVFTKIIPANKRVALMMPVADAMQADYQAQNYKTLDTACLSSISAYLTGLLAYTTEDEALKVKEQIVVNILTFSVFLINKGVFSLGINLLESTKGQIQVQLGENHPDYATSLNNLAGLYESMGEYEKALPLYEQALSIRKTQLGENHPDYAGSLNNLAFLYNSMGEYEKALSCFEQALAITKTQLGENHPDYATSLNNLAGLYESKGEYEKALSLYKQAFYIRKTQLGEDHPSYASSLNNLAFLYKSMGKYEQALLLFEQALDINKTQLGENHPDYAISLNNLAILYYSMGEYDKALPLYEQALAIRKTQLGENHPDYATSLNGLALLYDRTGEYAKALPLYKQALSITKTQLGENHPSYAASLNNLAGLYESMGEYEKALPLYEQALDIRKTQLGENHPSYAVSLNNLASFYRMGEYEQALPLYEQALDINKTQLGENHPDYATSLNNLAGLYESKGEYEKALSLYKQAFYIRKTQLGENHPDYASSLNNLAGLYDSTGEYEKALPLYKQALTIYKTQLGENHPDYASSLNNLAGLYESMGEYEKALPLYEQAINIAKQVLGEAHPHTQAFINNYLTCQHQAQNKLRGTYFDKTWVNPSKYNRF